MILNRLELHNFKKYSQKSFEFAEGLIGIIGKNGSGKSTIFEAILFALYGELKTKGIKDLVKNINANQTESIKVILEFEIDAISYKIVREFRGKALMAYAFLYKNSNIQIVAGAKEVTKSITRLVKMGKDAFVHTIFANQKELTSLSNLKPEERKKMIRKLLGLEKIDIIENMLIEKSRDLQKEINAFADVLLSNDEVKKKEIAIQENNKEKDKKNLSSRGPAVRLH